MNVVSLLIFRVCMIIIRIMQVSLLPPEEIEAVRSEHLHVLLANRSAAYQQLKQFDKAAADAEACTKVKKCERRRVSASTKKSAIELGVERKELTTRTDFLDS